MLKAAQSRPLRNFGTRDGTMRAPRFVVIPAMSLVCGIAMQQAAQSLEVRGTLQQQLACTGDVLSLAAIRSRIPTVSSPASGKIRRSSATAAGRCSSRMRVCRSRLRRNSRRNNSHRRRAAATCSGAAPTVTEALRTAGRSAIRHSSACRRWCFATRSLSASPMRISAIASAAGRMPSSHPARSFSSTR